MPGPSVSLHAGAQRDIQDGLAFYLTRSPMVAERFLHEIDMALELIADAPDRWPLSRGNTRRYVMSTFPYCIVYRIMKNAVQVFAVAHAKRRPQYWQDRRFEST